MSGPEPAAHMPHIHTSCRSERYVVNFSTVCIQQKSLNYTTNIEYARSGQYSNVVEFELRRIPINFLYHVVCKINECFALTGVHNLYEQDFVHTNIDCFAAHPICGILSQRGYIQQSQYATHVGAYE